MNTQITPLFSSSNAAMLLIDHQIGTMGWVKSADLDWVKKYTVALAKAAQDIKMPLILSSSMEDQVQGLLFDELREAVPIAYQNRIQRAGIVDSMKDDNFAQAVKDTGRQNLIMAGITTDVCVVFPAMTAIAQGYSVQVVVDACGSPTSMSDDIALRRMESAGVILTTTSQLIAELARDWTSEDGSKLIQIGLSIL